jgi:2,3-bisphosphoglycerate-dependent phosphoglycerate mutase
MRITFARHGESQANILRQISNRGLVHPLTFRGREQAAALADKLQDRAITRIYTSPLLRAIETSVIVAERLGVDYEVTDALREFDCGIAEGRADEAAWQMWHEVFDAWTIHRRWEQRIEGGESFYDVRDRFVPFVEGLVAQYGDSDANLLCVAHGGVLWMMLPLVLPNVDNDLMSKYRIDHTTCIVAELNPDGLCCVEWDGVRI